jgi:hypothetical protein
MSHALLQHENEALTVEAAFAQCMVSQRVDSAYEAMDVDLCLILELRPEIQAEKVDADGAATLLDGVDGFEPDKRHEFPRRLVDQSS